LYGSGIVYLGSENVFTNTNTFTYMTVNNDLTINGNLYVQTNNSVTLVSYSVAQDMSLNGRLYVTNDASLGGNVIVGRDISANERLFVTGDASLGGRLFVNSDVSLNGYLYANYPASTIPSAAIIGMNLFSTDVSMNGRLYIASDVSANNCIFVGGDASLGGNLYINNYTIANSDVSMNGALSVFNNIYTNGSAIIASDVSSNGRLFVGGDASFGGNVRIYGQLSVQNSSANNIINTITTNVFTISEDISLNGRIRALGDASFGGNLNVVGNANISGNINLPSTGTHTISGNVTITGNSTCGNSTVSANETVGGTETITGLLTANGGVTIASGQTLTLTGVTVNGLTTASVSGLSSYATTTSLSSYAGLTSNNNFTGNIGIGTTPSYPLHVNTTLTSAVTGYYLSSATSTVGQVISSSRPVSIYSTGVIYSNNYIVASDQRIKTNVQHIDDASALQTLLQLQPKTFNYIDTMQQGAGTEYGFIAQDLMSVFDNAVTTLTDKVPNVYGVATVTQGTVLTLQTKTTDLFLKNDTGEFYPVKVYDASNQESLVHIVHILDSVTFEIDTPITEAHVFVYGQEVTDFHGIRWNDITTVNTASIQALYAKIQTQEQQIAELQASLAEIRGMLDRK
jgi:predicted acyltransferase (DUF342 family)